MMILTFTAKDRLLAHEIQVEATYPPLTLKVSDRTAREWPGVDLDYWDTKAEKLFLQDLESAYGLYGHRVNDLNDLLYACQQGLPSFVLDNIDGEIPPPPDLPEELIT